MSITISSYFLLLLLQLTRVFFLFFRSLHFGVRSHFYRELVINVWNKLLGSVNFICVVHPKVANYMSIFVIFSNIVTVSLTIVFNCHFGIVYYCFITPLYFCLLAFCILFIGLLAFRCFAQFASLNE